MDQTPHRIYAFFLKDGRIVDTTSDREKARAWKRHQRMGEVIGVYTLEKEHHRQRGTSNLNEGSNDGN